LKFRSIGGILAHKLKMHLMKVDSYFICSSLVNIGNILNYKYYLVGGDGFDQNFHCG
jgi:hypothetical protein